MTEKEQLLKNLKLMNDEFEKYNFVKSQQKKIYNYEQDLKNTQARLSNNYYNIDPEFSFDKTVGDSFKKMSSLLKNASSSKDNMREFLNVFIPIVIPAIPIFYILFYLLFIIFHKDEMIFNNNPFIVCMASAFFSFLFIRKSNTSKFLNIIAIIASIEFVIHFFQLLRYFPLLVILAFSAALYLAYHKIYSSFKFKKNFYLLMYPIPYALIISSILSNALRIIHSKSANALFENIYILFFTTILSLIIASLFLAALVWRKKHKILNYACIILLFISITHVSFSEFLPPNLLLISLVLALIPTYFLNFKTSQKRLKEDFKNEQLAMQKHNDNMSNKIRNINKELASIDNDKQELMRYENIFIDNICQLGSGWFPPDYYSSQAVKYFIHALKNHKADTVKEMVLQYDDWLNKEQNRAMQQRAIKLSEAKLKEMRKQNENFNRYNNIAEAQLNEQQRANRINAANVFVNSYNGYVRSKQNQKINDTLNDINSRLSRNY